MTDSVCPGCGAPGTRMLWSEKKFAMMRCFRCRLHWAMGRSPALYDKSPYNSAYYETNYLPVLEQSRDFFRKELKALSQGSRGGRVLDVGFGVGNFLVEAAGQGWEIAGVEPSAFAFEYGKTRLPASAELFQGDLGDAPWTGGSFDLVTFWDVLAHLPNPGAAVERAAALLKEGGRILIKTPFRPDTFFGALRFFSFFGDEVRRSLLHYPMQLFYFNTSSLEQLISRRGLKDIAFRPIPEPLRQRTDWKVLAAHPRGLMHHLAHRCFDAVFPGGSLVLVARR